MICFGTVEAREKDSNTPELREKEQQMVPTRTASSWDKPGEKAGMGSLFCQHLPFPSYPQAVAAEEQWAMVGAGGTRCTVHPQACGVLTIQPSFFPASVIPEGRDHAQAKVCTC